MYGLLADRYEMVNYNAKIPKKLASFSSTGNAALFHQEPKQSRSNFPHKWQ